MPPKKKKAEAVDLLSQIEQELLKVTSTDLDIIEFIETIADAFDPKGGMFLSQRVMLKMIYNLPMSEEELALAYKWRNEEKTNWLPNDLVLAELNAEREAQGKEAKEAFNYLEIVMGIGMRSGKTLKDSLIRHKDGGLLYFSELFKTQKSGEAKRSFDQDFEVKTRWGWKKVHTGFTKPPERCINFRTRYGYEIGGAVTHPLLVFDASGKHVWKKMPDIKLGDYLCIERTALPETLQMPHLQYNGRQIDPVEMGYFLGLLVGDGCTSTANRISLTNNDFEILDWYKRFCESAFGLSPKTFVKAGTTAVDLVINNTDLRTWLQQFLGQETAYNKKVPVWVRSAPRSVVRAFLQGLFDTDGCVEGKDNAPRPSYTSASEQLVREVQVLLLDFGIISSRKFKESNYVRKNGKPSTSWSLYVYGEAAELFRDSVGFRLTRKQHLLDSANWREGGSGVDKIPHLHTMLKGMKKHEGNATKRHLWEGIRRQCTNTMRSATPSGITYSKLSEIQDYFSDVLGLQEELDHLKHLQDQHLFYDQIVETWDTEEPMFDLGVAEVEEYVANGVVSHNSSTVGLMVAYEFYKLFINDNPQKNLFGLPSSSLIYLTVLASSERQTLGTIFGYVKNYISDSTFFKKYIDDGDIIVKETEIVAPKKHIIIGSGHSRADTLVGRTAVMVAFDELAMFSSDDGKTSNASDVYSRVGRATATFPDYAKRVALSSAKEEKDFMQQLKDKGWDKQRMGTLIFDLSTFDFNPMRTKDDPVIAGDYARDPIAAARDYENIRPSSAYSFINPLVIDAATYEPDPLTGLNKARNPQKYAIYRPMINRTKNEVTGEVRETSALELSSVAPAAAHIVSYAHADPGVVRDSFGFAVGHAESSERGVVTVIDLVLEWVPQELGKGKRAIVDMINVEDVILEVCKARKVQRLSFDHWESAGSIQRMFRENIPTYQHMFSRGSQFEMYDALRVRLNQGLVKIPGHPVLVEELKNLQVNTSGTKVDHPKAKDTGVEGRSGTIGKDLADCIAVINWNIAQYEKVFDRSQPNSFKSEAGGMARSLGRTRASRITFGNHWR